MYYKLKKYPFAEAIQCHRETHHSEMCNKPNANVEVLVELNTQGEKKVTCLTATIFNALYEYKSIDKNAIFLTDTFYGQFHPSCRDTA